MVKRNYKRRMYEISTLKKLSVIFVVYVILYGPFSIVTIFLSFSQYKTARMERYVNIAIVISFIAFIVDPFLYAWRYKMCRLHMMKMVCFFRKAKVNEITKTLNDRYCTYRIEMAPRTTTTIVWLMHTMRVRLLLPQLCDLFQRFFKAVCVFVVLLWGFYVTLTIFQSYGDREAGIAQSLTSNWCNEMDN